ncbi:ribosome hibernation-promoting factor, HPF/YfiA family [Marixanthomonas spongiae]|uniref:Ribosome-associated translation inhibitor RaiA n=1 Tax=Marixanthomonas spongiae TaxID=2174845 RepID=A0A2U0I484_9FLAO|nr:ribosome-associated translation inhibitor RaiA [Marixanthomonas spongiae]PVW15884.1 ribosome-associated translation inhibitor RaiA [Marixanthomonas spongiae]
MEIDVQYEKMKESEALNAYLMKKLEKLSKKYEWLIRAEVAFKKGQDKTGLDCICEITLSAPGPRIFAASTERYFESALKETINDLERQLKKRKAQFTAP